MTDKPMDVERTLRELETKWRESAREYERLAHVAKQRDPEQSEVTGGYLALMDERDDCADELKAVREALREPGAPNAEREIPLCANHAETWFCERNHLPNPTANCVLCAFAPTGTQPGAGAAPPVSQERSAMEREAGTR